MKAASCTRATHRLRTAGPFRAAAVAVASLGLVGALLPAAWAQPAEAMPSAPPAAATAQAAQMGLDARYDAARDDFEVGHFQAAFDQFAALADAGHCGAARMALQMLRGGKAHYATEFRAPLARAQQWQQLQACATPTRHENLRRTMP